MNVSNITDYKYIKAEKLSKRDVVIIWGGARDVARNETKEGLRSTVKLIRLLTKTNVIITCVPHRSDLQAESCVNKAVKLFNRKLQKQMKTFGHEHVCSISENREHFTSHGLHMNFKGKLWITNKWASSILLILSRLQTSPATPLPWIKETENGHMEYEKKNESVMKKPRDQNVSLSKKEAYCSVPDSKVLSEDNEELIDLIEIVGSPPVRIREQDKNSDMDEDNSKCVEPESIYGPSEKMDEDNLNSSDKENKEVLNLTELIGSSPLEIGDKGNSRSKNIEKTNVSELKVTQGLNGKINNEKSVKVMPKLGSTRQSNRIKNSTSVKQNDFLWSM
ncbi:hypothetical protein B7P43_G08093 [Cryptotermes secundus]|uniref:Uncharacterized protein n=1 Tax=Cryptotermes secundus TaxID=105785 RepID=A0A2J7R8C7_9NEOP|nr:hypothetical protein B7P43_G08093 [Cryptotermes secundus]